jgi:hypothetical protein
VSTFIWGLQRLKWTLIDQRLEEARVSEQAADITRQEKLLKLISNELTKNTTRVVEMAVKAEVQNSVLPALENITKNEVKAVLVGQIAKGLGDSMNQVCSASILFHPRNADNYTRVSRQFLLRLKGYSFDLTYPAMSRGHSPLRLLQLSSVMSRKLSTRR